MRWPILFITITAWASPTGHNPTGHNPTIRVLLKEVAPNSTCTFQSSSGFTIAKTKNSSHKEKLSTNTLTALVRNNKLIINDDNRTSRTLKSNSVKISSVENAIVCDDVSYTGSMVLKLDTNGSCKIINFVDLDDYIYSVLKFECYQTWPETMQKIQAIASRTYAAYCIKQAHRLKKPYDIKRTNVHQVYNGTHEYEHLRKAVKATSGTALSFDGDIALTMYDACCGGCIPAKLGYFDFDSKPYLKRNYPCHYCNSYNLYRWEHRFNLQYIADNLRSNPSTMGSVYPIGLVRKIEVVPSSVDGTGIGHEVLITGTKGKTTLSGAQFYEIVRHKAKSRSYSIKMDGFGIKLKGRGFGHLVGMCQRGARELVRRKWNVKQILSFYYPGTELKKLEDLI